MKPPPGARLHALFRAQLPAALVDEVLEPAIADLQYEAEHAATRRERRDAIRRGHAAIVRALVLSIDLAGALRATLALLALCAMGTLLVTAARAAHVEGRVLNSAILAPGMLAPVILRILGTVSSRRLFAGSFLVAAVTLACAGTLEPQSEGALWVRLAHVVIVLAAFAPMAAAAAMVAAPGRETFAKSVMTAVSLGSGIATSALLVARWPQGEPLSMGLAMTPFYVALFAVLFALTLLPWLLLARAFIAGPARLALAGLACSPAPLIAGAYMDHGSLAACLDAVRATPLSFATWSVPFVMGAVAVGWRLPPRVGTREQCPDER